MELLYVSMPSGMASGWTQSIAEKYFDRFGDVLDAYQNVDVFVLPERKISVNSHRNRRPLQCQARNLLLLELRDRLDQKEG